MNQTDPLAALKDIHLPADPSWWPPAIGWWILALCLLLCGYQLIRLSIGWRRRRTPSRMALVELAALENRFRDSSDQADYLQKLSILVRRFVLLKYARRELATLSGLPWLNVLNEASGTRLFTDGPARALDGDVYRQNPEINAPAITDALRRLFRNQMRWKNVVTNPTLQIPTESRVD